MNFADNTAFRVCARRIKKLSFALKQNLKLPGGSLPENTWVEIIRRLGLEGDLTLKK